MGMPGREQVTKASNQISFAGQDRTWTRKARTMPLNGLECHAKETEVYLGQRGERFRNLGVYVTLTIRGSIEEGM